MISSFLLVPALVNKGLSPFLSPFLFLLSLLKKGICSIMISCFLLVPALVNKGLSPFLSPLLSLLSLLKKGLCSIMISCFLLVPALVPGLVSLLVSLLVFLKKECVPSWFPKQLLSWMGCSILARNGLCSIMICCSSWFRLGFRCLSPFLLSSFFSRKRVLLHHDVLALRGSGSGAGACLPSSLFFPFSGNRVCSIMVLVPPGSGSGSGACLPSAFFFLFSGKGFCSIIICWLLLVPAQVRVVVSLLISSFFSWKGVLFHHHLLVAPGSGSGSGGCLPSYLFFLFSGNGVLFHHHLLVAPGSGSGSGGCLPSYLFFLFQERGSVPSWCAGSSWFRLGFRCLSPFCFLLAFLRSDFVVFPGSGWGSGACLPSSLFFSSERGSVPSWCAGSFWFRLRFRCLFPFFSLFSFLRNGVLFHHDFLVPGGSGSGAGACLPSSFFFLFSGNGVLFPGSGSGSGACLPSSLFFLFSGKGFCSIIICWLLLVPAQVRVVVSLLISSFFFRKRGCVPSWFPGSFWFRFWFRCLSPFCFLLAFLRSDFVVFPGSGWGSGACLPSSLFFSSERGSVPSWCAGSFWFRLGFRCLCPFFSLLFIFSGKRFCSATIAWFRFYSGFLCSFFDFISDQWISKWAMNEVK